jgi:hypothetical protein
LLFLPVSLEDLDSINFALGLRHFDVAHHQPHPPGYPLYIAAAKVVHLFVPSEAKALSLVSVIAGSLSVFALLALFDAIDPGPRARRWSIMATLMTMTAPLYWFTAARPLSDMPGLAAALAVQALTMSVTTNAGLAAASFLAAFAAGLRSQVVWLTVPLMALTIARRQPRDRASAALGATGAFLIGGLAWAVPLVALSGGPGAYWRAMFTQGAEDLSGVQMLWTAPTARQLLLALNSAFVAPWAIPLLAGAIMVLATAGVIRLSRGSRSTLVTLTAAFGPYFVFDLLFQESVTTRYSLPLVPPMAYLAVRAAAQLDWSKVVPFSALALFNLIVATAAVSLYGRAEAPAFRLLDEMRTVVLVPADARRPAPSLPVLAMHRREDLDLRRPIAWLGDRMVRVSQRLAAPPKHEWLEMVRYWNSGGRGEVWFVADPLRTDLALVDHPSGRYGAYRWLLPYHALIGGIRPDVMDWYRIREPGWYLGQGWALTPETAGVAKEDGRGPGRAPVEGWIRRRTDEVTLMIGGRNLALGAGPPARARIAIDGRTIDEPTIAPGYFLRMLRLAPGTLDGAGDYAPLTVGADQPTVAIEQFNAQSSDRVVYGFGDGWYEHEYNPAIGLEWRWMSERAVLRVHAAGHSLMLTMHGDPPRDYFPKPSSIRISAGGRLIATETAWSDLVVRIRIPAELVADYESPITIETDQAYVPAERSRRSPDRRHLGLRVFECDLRRE